MTDEKQAADEPTGADENPGDEQTQEDAQDRTRREAIEDRLKEGLNSLGAMRDNLEETIREARERGDLSADGAKRAMREALEKAQVKAGEAREAFDFVKQKEFDGLRDAVEDLKVRMGIVEKEVGVETPDAEPEQEDAAAAS